MDWIDASDIALRVTGEMDVDERREFGLNLWATNDSLSFSTLSEACLQSPPDTSWNAPCRDVMVAMATRSNSLLSEAIGSALAIKLLTGSDEDDMLAVVEAKRREIGDVQKQIPVWQLDKFLTNDPGASQRFYDAWRARGETAAFQLAIDSARTAYAQGTYSPCD
ncbi:MAG: hypothetical protein AAFU65_05720 [Pseudomonadota bacterium]